MIECKIFAPLEPIATIFSVVELPNLNIYITYENSLNIDISNFYIIMMKAVNDDSC